MPEQDKREPHGLLRDYRVVGVRSIGGANDHLPRWGWATYAHKDQVETGPYYVIHMGLEDPSVLDGPADRLCDGLFPDEQEYTGHMEWRTFSPGLLTQPLEIKANHSLYILATRGARVVEWLYLPNGQGDGVFATLSRRKLRAALRLEQRGRFAAAQAAAWYAYNASPSWEAYALGSILEMRLSTDPERRKEIVYSAFHRIGDHLIKTDDPEVPASTKERLVTENANLEVESIIPHAEMLALLTSLHPLIRRRFRRVG